MKTVLPAAVAGEDDDGRVGAFVTMGIGESRAWLASGRARRLGGGRPGRGPSPRPAGIGCRNHDRLRLSWSTLLGPLRTARTAGCASTNCRPAAAVSDVVGPADPADLPRPSLAAPDRPAGSGKSVSPPSMRPPWRVCAATTETSRSRQAGSRSSRPSGSSSEYRPASRMTSMLVSRTNLAGIGACVIPTPIERTTPSAAKASRVGQAERTASSQWSVAVVDVGDVEVVDAQSPRLSSRLAGCRHGCSHRSSRARCRHCRGGRVVPAARPCWTGRSCRAHDRRARCRRVVRHDRRRTSVRCRRR